MDDVIIEDEGERINQHIQSSGLKQSTGGKQLLESNLNDRASEELSVIDFR
jgi:hypothetical protein